MKSNKSGFSLIELSIVLIIIGLLVAGITGGASLIKSAELRSTMNEIRNYQTAINAYYTATGYLPAAENSAEMAFENAAVAWTALYDEGIIDTAPASESTVGAEDNFNKDYGLKSKIKGSYYLTGYNDTMKQNVIFLVTDNTAETPAGETPTTLKTASDSVSLSNASINREDAKFLDEKMDNGEIDSGKVYSFDAGTSGACAYTAGDKTKDCAMAFGIGL